MKHLLILPFLIWSLHSSARKIVVVDKGVTTTAPGIGGTADLGYAFAKGDIITIDAMGTKQLERMLAFVFPEKTVGRVKYRQHPKLTFTMPEEGIVVFRFVSDRAGTNIITYTVTRMPASDAVQDYSTKIVWEKPTDRIGNLVPKRVEITDPPFRP